MLVHEATILYFVMGAIVIFAIERKTKTRRKGTLHEAMDYSDTKSSPVPVCWGAID